MLPSVEHHARECVQQLFDFLDAQGKGDYLGESVSQLEHSLQAAQLAVNANADNETILGALLHDVGRFIPASAKMPAMIAPNGTFVGRASHEKLGESYLRELGFSETICQLVGAHVMAKRYLTAVDKDYYEGLSETSKTTLKFQGGIFSEKQVKEAQKDPLLEAKLSVRRWDDLAKDPNMKTLPLSHYQDMAVENLVESRSEGFTIHGKAYKLPTRPTVAICVDGFDPEYLQQGIADGVLPNMAKMVNSGFHGTAHCAMPSFTNPNNVSIITGAPTSKHGIAGNFYLDPVTHEEKMVLDDTLLRGSTILEQLSRRGVTVAAITAKDKLRAIINHGLDPKQGHISFSAQNADACTLDANGIEKVEEWLGLPKPSQYSGELSLFVLDAGVKLLKEKRADFYYLTLSDFIQHKHAPGSKVANEFMAAIDKRIGQLIELGAVVAVTGDHGMSDKSNEDGSPNVLFLETELEKKFGAGFARIICPITDPFVRHHGALGSFVRVHIDPKKVASVSIPEVVEFISSLPQVMVALDGPAAAERFEMPADREADIVVVSQKNAVIGSRKEEHDFANLKGHRLRSHGGLSEQEIPLLRSLPIERSDEQQQWHNYNIFDLLLNY